MNSPEVNPDLFKGEAPKELQPRTYYAYLDCIEKIYGTTFLRFDCIEKNLADGFQINKESVVGLPSVLIDISGPNSSIDNLFGISGVFAIYNFESQWMVIKTITEKSELTVSEFFNFTQVGNEQTLSNYSINVIVRGNDLDSQSVSKIAEIKSANQLTESPIEDVLAFIEHQNLESFSHVNVYNVGQGNCNALVDSHNVPLLYFDVGGGSGANAFTYPRNFELCHTYKPSVILSHWDLDHMVSAVYHKELLMTKWLVPLQASLSNTAIQIASALQRRNNLICWNASLGEEISLGNHFLTKCSARPTNKNSSGLAMYINYGAADFILLPGDATFYLIPNIYGRDLIGIVASHHGAKSSLTGIPGGIFPSMLAYSFGVNNTYGHAHNEARNDYARNNWGIGLETVNGNIALKLNPRQLNVPCNSWCCSLNVTQHF
jgi:hypothetical protein